jgi:hypothetical protein
MSEDNTAKKEQAKKLTDKLTDFVNNYNSDNGKLFIEAFEREHRTLQQSSFRLILELIEHMASDDYQTDGRNEASKKIAKSIMKGFKHEVKQDMLNQRMAEHTATQYAETCSKPHEWLPYV